MLDFETRNSYLEYFGEINIFGMAFTFVVSLSLCTVSAMLQV